MSIIFVIYSINNTIPCVNFCIIYKNFKIKNKKQQSFNRELKTKRGNGETILFQRYIYKGKRKFFVKSTFKVIDKTLPMVDTYYCNTISETKYIKLINALKCVNMQYC